MTRDKLTQIVEQALRDVLGSNLVDEVGVAEGRDHDEQPALFVTVRYRPNTNTVDQTTVLGAVRDRLRAEGEYRFPYMNYVYPDDLLADDDEADDERSTS